MRYLRVVITLTLVALLCGAFVAPAFAVTRSDLEKHQSAAEAARKKAAKAEAAAKELTKDIDALEDKIEALEGQAAALSPKIALATKKTDRLQSEVAVLRAQCDRTQAEIDETQAQYDKERELLAARVASSYKQGTWFYLDMLLGSQDFDDLIMRTELVNRVIESNNNIAAELDHTKETLVVAKEKLDRDTAAVKLKAKEAQAVESRLRELRAQRRAAANSKESAQAQKASLLKDTKANAKRLRALAESEERESDRIASMLSGGGSGAFSGSMAWPVPASHRVTSKFGWRICPFHGREMHPGIDIGAPSGSSIVAAGSGKVIYASRRGGYGNTVMIDHGNGVVTLYAHQREGGIKVRVGERVSKGERIGTVGSTGYSTGPHLHFEVRVNGKPKNPRSYTG